MKGTGNFIPVYAMETVKMKTKTLNQNNNSSPNMFNSGTAIEKNWKKIFESIKNLCIIEKTEWKPLCAHYTMRCGSAKIWTGSLIRLWLAPPKLGHLNFCACTPRNFPGARAQETLPDFLQKFLSEIFVKIIAHLLGKPHGQQPKLLLTKIVQFLYKKIASRELRIETNQIFWNLLETPFVFLFLRYRISGS